MSCAFPEPLAARTHFCLPPTHHTDQKMQGFAAASPAPRRTVHGKRAASQELSPPAVARRRSVAPTGGRPAARGLSRMHTPMRTLDRLSSARDDESAAEGMDVDEAADVNGVERALKFDTVFAKSEEMQVSFYAHLPAEVKLILRNAGACGCCLCDGQVMY